MIATPLGTLTETRPLARSGLIAPVIFFWKILTVYLMQRRKKVDKLAVRVVH